MLINDRNQVSRHNSRFSNKLLTFEFVVSVSNVLKRNHYGTKKSGAIISVLTHFSPIFHFYTTRKRQKTFSRGYRKRFQEGVEMEHWAKMG